MKQNIKLESGKLLGYRITTSRGRDVNTKLGAKVGGKPPVQPVGIQIGAKIGVVKP